MRRVDTTESTGNSSAGKASDHLANERTYLAWIRTSISVIVFGFAVAKFGTTLREILYVRGVEDRSNGFSLVIGIGFMAIGIAMSLMSCIRYQRTRAMLDAGTFRPANRSITALAFVAAVFGAVLAGYLVYTRHAF
jgi:putative membrane protein